MCTMKFKYSSMWSGKDLKIYVIIFYICVIITGIGASHKHEVLL